MSQVLVVASKVKAYIKEQSGMNTSASVMEALTKVVEHECNKAIEKAKGEKRKTVMDRDFAIRP
jgi:histone H3/H4